MADLICGAESSTSSISSLGFLFASSHSLNAAISVRGPANSCATPYAAPRLHERGGFEIRLVHDQARRQLEERGALVRARNQDAGNTKRARTDVDLRAHGHTQCRRESRIWPYLAARRDSLRRFRLTKGLVGQLHAAAQRIFLGDRSQRCQLIDVAVEHHTEEARGARDIEAASLRLHNGLVVHRLSRFQAKIGREDFARLVVDRDANPIDEKAHASQRRHRHGDREHEHAELAGLPFAEQRTQCKGHGSHGARLISADRNPCAEPGHSVLRRRDRE